MQVKICNARRYFLESLKLLFSHSAQPYVIPDLEPFSHDRYFFAVITREDFKLELPWNEISVAKIRKSVSSLKKRLRSFDSEDGIHIEHLLNKSRCK